MAKTERLAKREMLLWQSLQSYMLIPHWMSTISILPHLALVQLILKVFSVYLSSASCINIPSSSSVKKDILPKLIFTSANTAEIETFNETKTLAFCDKCDVKYFRWVVDIFISHVKFSRVSQTYINPLKASTPKMFKSNYHNIPNLKYLI